MKSTLDGWRSAGEPRAPGLGLFVFGFFSFTVCFVPFFTMTIRTDEREKRGGGTEKNLEIFCPLPLKVRRNLE